MDVSNARKCFELQGLNPVPLCSCSLTYAIISVSFLTEKQKIQQEALVSQNRHIRRKIYWTHCCEGNGITTYEYE